MKLSFHGAAREVTGSCYLLEVRNIKILIDCGLFQGSKKISDENKKPFGFKPSEINYLLLTHAHLDHCGRIPLLVKQGFKGEIITTPASRELAKLIMLDTAHLNEEESKRESRYLKRHSSKYKKNNPLYNTLDVLNTLDFFGRNAIYGKKIELTKNINITFFDAGHIIGSAFILLDIKDGKSRKKMIFSGDLGNNNKPIIRDPSKPVKADYLVMETTYGDRPHKPVDLSVNELYSAINETFSRGGNVYIPTFALERAQELLFFLREGIDRHILPVQMQVFLDSPMAISATEIYRHHSECYDSESGKLFNENIDPFQLPNLTFTRDTADSIAINKIKSGAIIMAGSGMCTGGRILHHLKHNLWRENCGIIFVSFAAKGTLARKIIDGEKSIRIYGEDINVNAKIYTINGFSAHADRNELIDWHKKTGNPKITFLVHGGPEAMASIGDELRKKGNHIKMPQSLESYSL